MGMGMYKGPTEKQCELADARDQALELVKQFLEENGLKTHYHNKHLEVHKGTIFTTQIYLGLVDTHPNIPTTMMAHQHKHVGDKLVRKDFDLHDPNSLKDIMDHLLDGLTISQWLTLSDE